MHRNELISVQWLRGLAVLMVLICHIEDNARTLSTFHDVKPFFVPLLYSGPDLFFVISGFIMSYVTFNINFEPKRWLTSRFIRIYPLYMLVTLFAITIWFIKPSMTMGSGEQTWGSVLASLFILPQAGVPLVFVGWTVEHEVLFYLIVFGVATLGGKMKALLATMGVFSLLAVLRFFLKTSYPMLDFWDYHFLSLFMVEFLIGALIFQFRAHLQRLGHVGPIIFGIALVLLGRIVVEPSHINYEPLSRVLIFGCAYGLILLGFINREKASNNRPSHRPFIAYVGDASYSIYLLHPFCLSLGGKILNAQHVEGYVAIMSVMLLGLLTLAAGMAFYHLIEKPFLQAMKRRT